MKKNFTLLLSIFCALISNAQNFSNGVYVSGRNIYDKCGSKITFKGINYPVLDDWNFPQTSEVSDQIEQTGTNAVRIQWYVDYGQPTRPSYSLADLDTVITRIARLDMIPVLELHDLTCQDDNFWSMSNIIVPWLTQQNVLNLIEEHRSYLVINLANEYSYVNWATNPNTAQTNYVNGYSSAIQALRTAGIHVPLMIDAPDCGSSLNVLVDVGGTLLNADVDGNLIFSTHTYWYGYTGNDSTAIRAEILTAVNSGLPIVFGEVATQQDDANPCQYQLNYKAILRMAEEFDIGWFIWAWYKDQCTGRELTADGNYSSLTTFGYEMINNNVYGFANVSHRSMYLVQNGNCSVGMEEENNNLLRIWPNPVTDVLYISFENASIINYSVINIFGQVVKKGIVSQAKSEINISGLPSGNYWIKPDNGNPVRFLKQ